MLSVGGGGGGTLSMLSVGSGGGGGTLSSISSSIALSRVGSSPAARVDVISHCGIDEMQRPRHVLSPLNTKVL